MRATDALPNYVIRHIRSNRLERTCAILINIIQAFEAQRPHGATFIIDLQQINRSADRDLIEELNRNRRYDDLIDSLSHALSIEIRNLNRILTPIDTSIIFPSIENYSRGLTRTKDTNREIRAILAAEIARRARPAPHPAPLRRGHH